MTQNQAPMNGISGIGLVGQYSNDFSMAKTQIATTDKKSVIDSSIYNSAR